MDKRYVVGIDLGTTNCAVCYVDLGQETAGSPTVKTFMIPQLTGLSEITPMSMLPSFLYLPGKYDISENAIKLPWGTQSDNFVGTFARDQGSKVPSRLVSSAKSWLCNANADRHGPILPWGSEREIPKVSPVEATAQYLSHIKKAWNSLQVDEDGFLENQWVIITIPASFDEVARDLTLEGAEKAGFSKVTLLEEPLAAFYNWLIVHEKDWHDHVREGELILICDVGGGTTDFTLITLKEVDGHPRFERIAVGDHLILGGDNIDIALARHIENRLGNAVPKLSPDRFKSLVNQCRNAKEEILEGKTQSRRISLVGQGSRLIAGALTAVMERRELEDIVLGSFFPVVDSERSPENQGERVISEFGLPYEIENAVTRHIGWFLEKHKDHIQRNLPGTGGLPDLVLFNGGALKPLKIQERIVRSIAHWFGDSQGPRVLENQDHDLAVARGAAYYGMVKRGAGVRVGSGSARGYYLGISLDEDGTRGKGKSLALCLVERGVEEGAVIELFDKTFEVLTNQPVGFDIYSSSFRSGDRTGDLIEIDETLTPLPPIRTVIQFGKKGERKKIPVHIQAEYTEVGTLALWCRSLITSHRWRLQFDLRKTASDLKVGNEAVFDLAVIEEIRQKIRTLFSPETPPPVLDASVKDIRDRIGLPREQWPLGLIRPMSDELLENVKNRKTGPDHEKRWLNLMGFCLRPGFGDGFDDHRIRKLWKIHGEGPIRDNQVQVRSEWWVMWRRVAGGLNAGQQKQFVMEAAPWVFHKKGKAKKATPQEQVELWMAVANMERLPIEEKIRWARHLPDLLVPGKSKAQYLWALSRFGARAMLYGSADRVVPGDEVWSWIETLMGHDWHYPEPVIGALVQMARKTGDRTRDLEEDRLHRVIDWVRGHGGSDSDVQPLTRVTALEKQEEDRVFGESLPLGLVLRRDGADKGR